MLSDTRETAGVLAGLAVSMMLAVLLLFGMTGGGFFLAMIVLMLLPMALVMLAWEEALRQQPAPQPVAHVVLASAEATAPWRWEPAAVGTLGAVGLFGVYFNVMTALEGFPHTLAHLRTDSLSILAVAIGFGIIAGVASHAYAAGSLRAGTFALGVIGSGVGMVTLLACCVPLLMRLVYWPGILHAAAFVIQYSVPLIIVALAINLATSVTLMRTSPQPVALR